MVVITSMTILLSNINITHNKGEKVDLNMIKGVLVMQHSQKQINGYFNLSLKKNCLISFLKRLANRAKIAIKILSKSIVDSLFWNLTLYPKNLSKKKPSLLRLGLFQNKVTCFNLQSSHC